MQKLLEKAARRAERAAVIDTCPTCPPQDDDPKVGRTDFLAITQHGLPM